jgi:hypothetical protein
LARGHGSPFFLREFLHEGSLSVSNTIPPRLGSPCVLSLEPSLSWTEAPASFLPFITPPSRFQSSVSTQTPKLCCVKSNQALSQFPSSRCLLPRKAILRRRPHRTLRAHLMHYPLRLSLQFVTHRRSHSRTFLLSRYSPARQGLHIHILSWWTLGV